MNKVFAVGVGPGSSQYVTDVIKNVISKCDVIAGDDAIIVTGFSSGDKNIDYK